MDTIIEGVIQVIGWSVLKAVSLGVYKSSGTHAPLVEGAAGLLTIAGVTWVVYHSWLAI